MNRMCVVQQALWVCRKPGCIQFESVLNLIGLRQALNVACNKHHHMVIYHGTDQTSANSILSKIDVSKGGGELGRGFYAGENISLAASFAKGKFGITGKVVELDVDNSEYVKLNIKTLNRRLYIVRLWHSLVKRKKAFAYLFNVDVVCAPFATIEFSYQYKFESVLAENMLNYKTLKKVL